MGETAAIRQPGEEAVGPRSAYGARVAAGRLSPDPAQAEAVERLDQLWATLGEAPAIRGWLARLRSRRPEVTRGLYLVGDVGRGKSMLMDLFFSTATVARKRRVHFHEFMQEAHQRIHEGKQAVPPVADPVPYLADQLAQEAALLCLDEFQVTDIADAMILGRLFEALFARGVVVVATSNVAPDDLFRGRPGRDAFLPFIAVLKRHVDVVLLGGARDWRRQRLREVASWHVPVDGRAERALDDAFTALSLGEPAQEARVTVAGRVVRLPVAAGGVVRCEFEALCGTALGAGDYLAIARRFPVMVLDAVPRLGPENFDRARRFVTLVDALYERRVQLVASAAAMPDALYERGEGAAAFTRTASRLEEMQSVEYRGLSHLG
ncbi:MAG: cell division protein ZapE [Janthinobacterium lividum]